MASQDALFNSSIFRKDNPIIIAARRELAKLIGIRLAYDAAGYMPGQCLVRKVSDGLFYKFSAASGVSYDSACVLFDQVTVDQETANGGGSQSGVQASTLSRALVGGIVYKGLLLDYDANMKTALSAKDITDAGGVQMTSF